MHLKTALLIGMLPPLALGFATCALAQSNSALPVNPPSILTKPSAAAPAGAVAAPPVTHLDASRPQTAPARRARVDFARGQLTVAAENSGLNQILRDISQATGLKITGGVTDERVFGVYGPGDVSAVLMTLLGGSGSNILIREDAQKHPTELVLTSRNGGPTPPSPNAVRDAGADLPPTPNARAPFRGFSGSAPLAPPPPQETQPPPSPPAQDGSPVADTTTQQSPNGVKTPQQVYEELLRLQGNGSSAPASLQVPVPK